MVSHILPGFEFGILPLKHTAKKTRLPERSLMPAIPTLNLLTIIIRRLIVVPNNNNPGTAGGPGGRDRTLAVKRRKNSRKKHFFFREKIKITLKIFFCIYPLVVPKYWGGNYFAHGRFPEVDKKQKNGRKMTFFLGHPVFFGVNFIFLRKKK